MMKARPSHLLPISLALLVVLAACVSSLRPRNPRLRSRYVETTADLPVSTTQATVALATTVSLLSQEVVYFQADGTYYPSGGSPGQAAVQIYVDGSPLGNVSCIDWTGSVAPGQHSFNAIGAALLDPGLHVVQLIAKPGFYTIGAPTSLGAYVAPAETVALVTNAPVGPYDHDSSTMQAVGTGVYQQVNYGDLPHTPMLSTSVLLNGEDSVFLLGSGSARHDGRSGDVMIGIFMDGYPPGFGWWVPSGYAHRTSFTVNDSWIGAELEAPFYCHGVFDFTVPVPGLALAMTYSLDATEFPYYIPGNPPALNEVRYTVDPTTSFVVMQGGMDVHGTASTNRPTSPSQNHEYFFVAGVGAIGTFNTWIEVAQATIDIPPTHDGIVFLTAKVRAQADSNDGPGLVVLRLEIDGKMVGSMGVQQLGGTVGTLGTSVSQRTLCASYLADFNNPLDPGEHTVRLLAQVVPFDPDPANQFLHLSFHNDRPLLLWF